MDFKQVYENEDFIYYQNNNDLLGRGACASVFIGKRMCKSTKKEEKIAIKEIRPNSANIYSDIEKEFSLIQKLQHPNIIQFYCSDKNKGYLFMELCESNLEIIEISQENYISFFKQIVDGLIYLHENKIIHRDLKPQNLLIKNEQIKIADFGVSRLLDTNASADTFIGSFLYMAPEILRNNLYAHNADIFSLGTTLFYLLYKNTPCQIFIETMKDDHRKISDINYLTNMYQTFAIIKFDPFKFAKKRFEIPQELQKIISDCLNVEPEKRPNLRDVLKILIQVQN